MASLIPWWGWFLAALVGWLATNLIDSNERYFTKILAGLGTFVFFVIAVVRLVHWAWVG